LKEKTYNTNIPFKKKHYFGVAVTRVFLKVLNSDAVKDSEWIYESKKGEKKCLLLATITMFPRGEEYNHYGIKRNLPATITNPLSDVLDQRYGVKKEKRDIKCCLDKEDIRKEPTQSRATKGDRVVL
jgi:hypothetical protein